eukprot:COSAG01_NODE_13070_length_1641_cov_1.622568_4_plen_52_part_01
MPIIMSAGAWRRCLLHAPYRQHNARLPTDNHNGPRSCFFFFMYRMCICRLTA